MDRLEYENYEEFACDIADKFDSLEDEFGDVSIIAKYEEAKEIIRELLCLGYDIASIDLHREQFEEYYDEYILDIIGNEIWCEKFKRDDKYITAEATVIYVLDNCSSKVIPHCHSNLVYEVGISENDTEGYSDLTNDTNNSESTYISRSKDGTPIGFSKTWTTTEGGITCYSSYSHYSDNIDTLKEIAKDFDVKL